MWQFNFAMTSLYSNCKDIGCSRCVLMAADITCGHNRRDGNYHDNANYADDNQLNRVIGIVAHHSQVLLTRFPEHWAQTCWCAAVRLENTAYRARRPLTLRCAADRHNYRLQELCRGWVSEQLGAMSHLLWPPSWRLVEWKLQNQWSASVCVRACAILCVFVYIRGNWALLLIPYPHSHPLSFFPLRSPSDSEVVFGSRLRCILHHSSSEPHHPHPRLR